MKKETGEDTGRIEEIKRKISAMDLICAGTLQKRLKTCGRPYCRCLTDPEALHGPYYEWTRYVDGRLVHKTLSPDQAQMLEQAIANNRELKALLGDWRHESAEIILGTKKTKA
ncbi:MAG: hypothetical protein QHG94_08040 [Candidatus Methanosuratincola sp.]|nr:hypothetical protein [Candidatus Methanosuratincola sp.]